MQKLSNERLAELFNHGGDTFDQADVRCMVAEILDTRSKSLQARGYQMFQLQESLHQTRLRSGLMTRVVEVLFEIWQQQNLGTVQALDVIERYGTNVSLKKNVDHRDAQDWLKKRIFGIQKSQILKEQSLTNKANSRIAI